MADAEMKNIDSPDEVRKFNNGEIRLVNVSGGTVGKMVFKPGWKWSNDVKPIAGTDYCQTSHFGYQISGRLHVKMKDGSEFETGPGDVSVVPPGHDAWVVGNEDVVLLDWAGASGYAKK
jgi:hypothetical protein